MVEIKFSSNIPEGYLVRPGYGPPHDQVKVVEGSQYAAAE
jgi:hypothetical protein